MSPLRTVGDAGAGGEAANALLAKPPIDTPAPALSTSRRVDGIRGTSAAPARRRAPTAIRRDSRQHRTAVDGEMTQEAHAPRAVDVADLDRVYPQEMVVDRVELCGRHEWHHEQAPA